MFGTYEGRIEKDNHTLRGINSIQLMNDGKRWWIVSLTWEAESEKVRLPEQLYEVGRFPSFIAALSKVLKGPVLKGARVIWRFKR